jgi:hypothetical protein
MELRDPGVLASIPKAAPEKMASFELSLILYICLLEKHFKQALRTG